MLSVAAMSKLDTPAEQILIRKWGAAAPRKFARALTRIDRIYDKALEQGGTDADGLLHQWAGELDAESAAAVIEALATDGPGEKHGQTVQVFAEPVASSVEAQWREALSLRDTDWRAYNSAQHQEKMRWLAGQVAAARETGR